MVDIKFKPGDLVEVRNTPTDVWRKGKFVGYFPNAAEGYCYACERKDSGNIITYKYIRAYDPSDRKLFIIMQELRDRIEHARRKHPEDKHFSGEQMVDALMGETHELLYAVTYESQERVYSEALDVAAVAMRIALGDYDKTKRRNNEN